MEGTGAGTGHGQRSYSATGWATGGHQQVGDRRAPAGDHVVAGAGRLPLLPLVMSWKSAGRTGWTGRAAPEGPSSRLRPCGRGTGWRWRSDRPSTGPRGWCRRPATRGVEAADSPRNRRWPRPCWDRRRRRRRAFPACRWFAPTLGNSARSPGCSGRRRRRSSRSRWIVVAVEGQGSAAHGDDVGRIGRIPARRTAVARRRQEGDVPVTRWAW